MLHRSPTQDLASAYFSRWLLLAGAISLRFMSLELFRDSASGHLLWGGPTVAAGETARTRGPALTAGAFC